MSSEGQKVLKIDDTSYTYTFLIIELPSLDLVEWLEAQPLFPKVYFEDKDTTTRHAAVGSLIDFHSIPNISHHSPMEARLFGANHHFWLPEFEVVQEKDRTYLQINFIDTPPSPRAMSRLVFDLVPRPEEEIIYVSREDTPSFETWQRLVSLALETFEITPLDKVVLARTTQIHGIGIWNPWHILCSLKKKVSNATFFLFQKSLEDVFLGASPEKLYVRQGLHIVTEALAGTHPQGHYPLETDLLRERLLQGEKETLEFDYVKQALEKCLFPLSTKIVWEIDKTTIATGSVLHLYGRLSATLKKPLTDRELVEILHPTPAISGYPKDLASLFLQHHEPFHRGLYASPIGILSSDQASFTIAIRSALIQGSILTLFAGVGIVPGSDPESEWQELEYKISPFLQSLPCAQLTL